MSYVDAERIVVDASEGKEEHELQKYMRSNQGTLIHQKPLVDAGERVKKGQVLADGSSRQRRAGARQDCLVAFMSCEGYKFEDAIIISERLVKDDELTSIHIEEYEIDARTTKLGDEEISRDIPTRSESRCATSTTAASYASAPRSAPATAGRQGRAQGRDRADRRGEATARSSRRRRARSATRR